MTVRVISELTDSQCHPLSWEQQRWLKMESLLWKSLHSHENSSRMDCSWKRLRGGWGGVRGGGVYWGDWGCMSFTDELMLSALALSSYKTLWKCSSEPCSYFVVLNKMWKCVRANYEQQHWYLMGLECCLVQNKCKLLIWCWVKSFRVSIKVEKGNVNTLEFHYLCDINSSHTQSVGLHDTWKKTNYYLNMTVTGELTYM